MHQFYHRANMRDWGKKLSNGGLFNDIPPGCSLCNFPTNALIRNSDNMILIVDRRGKGIPKDTWKEILA